MTDNNYTKITYQAMLEEFTDRLQNDPRFKNMSSASIYYLFIEMLTATMDMTNYYMERTAEEAFIDTAKLDSSVIKHGKNLGYNPIRNTPAEAEIAIEIKGPLPSTLLNKKATIYFSQDELELSFNGRKYILNTDYSYTFKPEDIEAGQSSTWSKTLYLSVPKDSRYLEIQGDKVYRSSATLPIKVFQGEVKKEIIYGVNNVGKLGKAYQFYDIDNIKFSNWYGKRDPNGWYKDNFYKKNSWTKIGIGATEENAFSDDNLYDIEDVSIYLNDQVQKFVSNDDKENFSTLKVCSLTTNSDKTIRLRFGDGIIVNNGLNNSNENIYIQYIECDGADANKVGTEGSELKVNNKIWATFAGGTPVDVSSNIKIVFNSDISNGVDFENKQSIKNNAPLYFASNNRLITKQDYISYFKGLTTPIAVKNAISWGQDEIEDGGNTIYKYIQNCVCYCIVSNLYNTKSYYYSPINVLLDNQDTINHMFSVYGDGTEYLTHLTDYVKFLYDFAYIKNQQYNDNPTELWLKNIKKIRDDAEPKMYMGTKLFSFPPIVQYYDVVGTVKVNSLAKLQEYKRTVENEIYEWLDNTCNFNTKIYKSDIIKFFNKHVETSSVNIDIRVSDIIKTDPVNYDYDVSEMGSITDIFTYINYEDTETEALDPSIIRFNTIILPRIAMDGTIVNIDNFKNKNIEITYFNSSENNENINGNVEVFKTRLFVNDASTNDDVIVLRFDNYYDISSNITTDNGMVRLAVAYEQDFSSQSNFSINNTAYGLPSSSVQDIKTFVEGWIAGATPTTKANRPIPLPYFVTAMSIDTRKEEIQRLGIMETGYETELTEKSFWQYVIPTIINDYYQTSRNKSLTPEKWINIDNLAIDLYTQLKATFADSILDDNNNIVYYSMDNELAVVRLKIDYQYGA